MTREVICLYFLTPCRRVFLANLSCLHLVKEFPAFYGKGMLITALTSVHHLSLSWANPIQFTYQIPTFHVLDINPNIIQTSKPRSPKCSLSLQFPHQDPVLPLSTPIRTLCPAHLNLLDFITRTILGEEYR